MKSTKKRRAIGLAVGLAVAMHLLLFIVVRPVNGSGLSGALVPPETHYLAPPSGSVPEPGIDIRTVWSPLLFSLPSEMGFSRDLLQEKLRTRLTFRQSDATESFLEVDLASRKVGEELVSQELLVAAGRKMAPHPPSSASRLLENQPAPRRVYVDPELKARLVGGVVLPPELNMPVDAAWEIHADMRISKQGTVQHVFLEQPLEAASLNQAIIRLLHGLGFKSGDGPVEGRIEIYSPGAAPGEGENP